MAEADLVEIYIRGAAEFGLAQADAYHTRLERIFELIADQPGIARIREEISPPVRVHPYGAHIIIYQEDTSGSVLIIRIRHSREDWLNDAV